MLLRIFLFVLSVSGGNRHPQFTSLPMITNAIVTFPTQVTSNIGTRAILQVYSDIRTCFLLIHLDDPNANTAITETIAIPIRQSINNSNIDTLHPKTS
jgi:hypothetical protein